MLRSGFTLLELLVALFVGTLIIEGARRLIEALAHSRSAISSAAMALDEHANAQMEARALVRQIHRGPSETILADDQGVTFTTSCAVAKGWNEQCRVTLSLVRTTPNMRLVIQLGNGIEFDTQFADVTGPFLYLSGDTREWTVRPGDRVAALGVVRARDTLLLPIAAR